MATATTSPALRKTYRVYAYEKVYYNIDVEATTEEEARRIAREETDLFEWDREPFENELVIYDVQE